MVCVRDHLKNPLSRLGLKEKGSALSQVAQIIQGLGLHFQG